MKKLTDFTKFRLVNKSGGPEPKVSVFDISSRTALEKFNIFLSRTEIFDVSDTFSDQIEELFQVRNPGLRKGTTDLAEGLEKFIESQFGGRGNLFKAGRWVYFPWRGTLTHLLPPDLYFELRTNRNRDVLTEREQKKYADFTVGILGLSVGNSIALTLALTGGSRTIKLADHDNLSLSNMNRIRASVTDLGLNKAYLAARQIYEIDPYSRIVLHPQGVSGRNLEDFFLKEPKLRLVVDAIDDLALKVKLRLLAKKYKVPVVMVTDCGQGALLDVERYDLDPSVKPFLGRVDGATLEKISRGKLVGKERLKAVTQIVDLKNVSARKTQSLLEIGKSFYTWPQLGSSITLCGVAAAFAVQKIALGESLNGSSLLSLEEAFLPKGEEVAAEREGASKEFLRSIELTP